MPPLTYLFILVMSALWKDIRNTMPTTQAHELLYADDTLLYAKTHSKLTATLKQVETESHRYGLALNYGKCEFIGINYGHKN